MVSTLFTLEIEYPIMTKKVAIILSGSGVFDGSEIHEAVMTFLSLEKNGLNYETYAPDIEQAHVINHLTGQPTEECRNVLVESNRLTRGTTKDLSLLKVEEHDAVIFVGGFGAAKNLSTFAFDGPSYTVDEKIKNIIKAFHSNSKYIVAMCIAPMVVAKCIDEIELTIGNDAQISEILESELGQNHIEVTSTGSHVDEKSKVITTPAYMLASNLKELEVGINDAVLKLVERI